MSTDRWKIEITGTDARATATIHAFVPRVAAYELGMTLLQQALELLKHPEHVFPTAAEAKAQEKRAAALRRSPAVEIWARGAKTLWLGRAAIEAVGAELQLRGWRSIATIPQDAGLPCDRALDEDTFNAKFLDPIVEPNAV